MKTRTTLITILIVALLVAGCSKNPFSLRDPEDPLVEEGTYVTPVDPNIALENLRFAMVERNLGHYVQVFSDSLEFTFDYLLTDQPGEQRGWRMNEDARIASRMFDGIDTIQLIWSLTPGRADQFDDSTAVMYRTYTLTIASAEAVGGTEAFEGEMIVRLERNTLELWWIVRWEDSHLTADSPSWADLKSRYR